MKQNLDGRLLQRCFTRTHDQTLEEITKTMSIENPYHKQLLSIIYILQKPLQQKHQKDLEEVENFFSSTFKFIGNLKDKLNKDHYLQIFKEIKFECLPQCRAIFQAGDVGKKMYFILHGEVGVLLPLPQTEAQAKIETFRQQTQQFSSKMLDSTLTFEHLIENRYYLFRLVTLLNKGDFFGEVAMQNSILRTGTVLTKTNILLGVMTFETYQKYIQLTQNQLNRDIIEFLTQISIFKSWSIGGLYIILRNCEEITYKPFEYIFKNREKAKYIYFIRQGEVKMTIYENSTYEQNTDLKVRRRSVSKINAVVQLTDYQHFGDWELYLPENDQLLDQKVDLQQKMEKITRISSVMSLSELKVIRMTLLQFLENYRIFGCFDIVKEICQQQGQVRNVINQKRTSIMKTVEINHIEPTDYNFDSQKDILKRPSIEGHVNLRQTYILPLPPVLQPERSSQKRINSQTLIEFHDGNYYVNAQPVNNKSQAKIDYVRPKLITDFDIDDINTERYKGLQPNDLLRIFDTSQIKNLTGQKRILQMIQQMGMRVDKNSPQYRLNNPRIPPLIRSSSQISETKKKYAKEAYSIQSDSLSPFKIQYYKGNQSDQSTSIVFLNPLPIENNSEKISPIKMQNYKSALFSNKRLKTQLQLVNQPQPQPFQFNNSYLSNQRSKLYKSWRKNKDNDFKFLQSQHQSVNQ